MADVAATLALWSSTTANNTPTGGTAVGTGLDDNLREIQGVVVRGLSHKGADIASAATTDIGAVEGSTHDITGTTSIVSFGTVRAGILKILQFDGVLTITHNATSLILKFGQNHLTTAGDILAFISEDSGNWREVWRNVAGGTVVPGTITIDAGTSAPDGWLQCYGQAVSRTTYSAIFSRLSTTYGVGDGSTTFNLPDLRGRVVAGQDDMGGSSANRLTNQSGGLDGDTLGDTGGSETHTLIDAELSSHTHTASLTVTGSVTNVGMASTGGALTHNVTDSAGDEAATVASVTGTASGTSAETGNDSPHNNVQPTIILNMIIKT
jgi:microcystin-dependent protein